MDTIAADASTIRVFVPVGKDSSAQARDAIDTVRTRTQLFVIGLLDNHKQNSGKVLDRLQHRLRERFEGVRFVRSQKPEAGKGASKQTLEALALECQAVVNGIGD
jgi:hypothetical protein